MKDLTEIITKIQGDISTSLNAQAKVLSHTSNWASILPSPCLRQQVYYRLDWEKQSLPDPRLQGIFNTGNLVEDMTIVNLNQIGIRANPKWELLKLPDKINDRVLAEHQIGSVTDVFLVVHNGKPENFGPVEIKSLDPNIYRVIHSIDDFQKYKWMRRYPGQLTTYEFGSNFEQGMFLLVNKTNWWDYKFFPHYLDMNFMQELLNKAKAINECVAKREYPDRPNDRSECEYCPFKAVCLPDEAFAQIELVANEELLALLEEREQLKESAKDFEDVDDKLKEIWKQTKEGTYLVGGKYQVKLKICGRTFYSVPPEIKEQYKDSADYTRATITKIQ
ncbi:MAG: hypothetical protein MUP81_03295 [Dehalococcoidia bacterium]|nr:hypothetical protein [Dehalococcoidia bacterium]